MLSKVFDQKYCHFDTECYSDYFVGDGMSETEEKCTI